MTEVGQQAREFAHEVIDWIRKQGFFTENQAPNYVVGITTGNKVIISKVGGVTTAARGMGALQEMVRRARWGGDPGREVYLAQKFTHDGNNNHAEMCVLAAADTLQDPLGYILCTADNCEPCYLTLMSANVRTGNDQARGTQQGWAHPRGRMQLGTGLPYTWDEQMAELRDYNLSADKEHFRHTCTQSTSWSPAGSVERLP